MEGKVVGNKELSSGGTLETEVNLLSLKLYFFSSILRCRDIFVHFACLGRMSHSFLPALPSLPSLVLISNGARSCLLGNRGRKGNWNPCFFP